MLAIVNPIRYKYELKLQFPVSSHLHNTVAMGLRKDFPQRRRCNRMLQERGIIISICDPTRLSETWQVLIRPSSSPSWQIFSLFSCKFNLSPCPDACPMHAPVMPWEVPCVCRRCSCGSYLASKPFCKTVLPCWRCFL